MGNLKKRLIQVSLYDASTGKRHSVKLSQYKFEISAWRATGATNCARPANLGYESTRSFSPFTHSRFPSIP